MLKLYTNTNFLIETYRQEVFPLLFGLFFLKNEALLNKYKLVNTPETSDIIVMPVNYVSFLKHKIAFNNLLRIAKVNNKPLWIYTAGDYGYTNQIINSYTFRFGGFDSKLNENVFILPSFINDPYQIQLPQGFSVLKKEEQPTIGFVGHAQAGIVKFFKEVLNHIKLHLKKVFKNELADAQPFYPSSVKRAEYLTKLANNDKLKTQFIFRNNYRAGSQTEITKQKSTKEFYDNMYSNAYTLCSRGVGNFSVRFYETLAVGRIPILLNTDCRLPLNKSIDWTKHCLIIDESSKLSIVDQILNFHNNLSSEEFIAKQESNRKLWLNMLRLDTYFLEVCKQFKTLTDNDF